MTSGARSDGGGPVPALPVLAARPPAADPAEASGGLLAAVEYAVKGPIWGCQMCGQCVLHSTGLTCPMNCPKTLRNGPCGGVRPDGHCEVNPEMVCVWLKGYQRSRRLPLWREHFNELRPPVDNRLRGTSSWRNLLTGRDRRTPAGWRGDVSA